MLEVYSRSNPRQRTLSECLELDAVEGAWMSPTLALNRYHVSLPREIGISSSRHGPFASAWDNRLRKTSSGKSRRSFACSTVGTRMYTETNRRYRRWGEQVWKTEYRIPTPYTYKVVPSCCRVPVLPKVQRHPTCAVLQVSDTYPVSPGLLLVAPQHAQY